MKNSLDGFETLIKSTGCKRDFVQQLDIHFKNLTIILDIEPTVLDCSLNSLSQLDRILITNAAINKQLLVKDLFYALLAYCGEVIRRKVQGKWVLNQMDERYFPSIVVEPETEYEFYGEVEDNFNQMHQSDLYYRIEKVISMNNKRLPVQQITEWFFPPIEE